MPHPHRSTDVSLLVAATQHGLTPSIALADPVIQSPAMIEVFRLIECYAPAETPVVFVGETGTGKSYLAELLHRRSGRPGPFEDVSAGELDDELASDRLFGHGRGAFTGAVGKRLGAFLATDRGTLLLDDLHLLRKSVQHRLLRVVWRREFKQVGSDRDVQAACRLVFGVGVEPDRLVAEGQLLPDLRGRMGGCIIRLLPLSERREEIAGYAVRFLAEAKAETGLGDGPTRLSDRALGVLERAPWPGNVRELKGMMVRAYLHARYRGADRVDVTDLAQEVVSVGGDGRFHRRADRGQNLRVVEWAMWRTGGNVSEAARLIGAHRNTVAALWATTFTGTSDQMRASGSGATDCTGRSPHDFGGRRRTRLDRAPIRVPYIRSGVESTTPHTRGGSPDAGAAMYGP